MEKKSFTEKYKPIFLWILTYQLTKSACLKTQVTVTGYAWITFLSADISINSLYPSTGMGTFVNPDLVKEYEEQDLRKAYSVIYADSYSSWNITKFRDVSEGLCQPFPDLEVGHLA